MHFPRRAGVPVRPRPAHEPAPGGGEIHHAGLLRRGQQLTAEPVADGLHPALGFLERHATVATDEQLAGDRIEAVPQRGLEAVGGHYRSRRQATHLLPAAAEVVGDPVRAPACLPDDPAAIGGHRDAQAPLAFAGRRLAGERGPGAAAIARVRRAHDGRIGMVQVAGTDQQQRLLARVVQTFGVAVARRPGELGGGALQVVVAETVDVAQPADQRRALRRTDQVQRHGLVQAGVVEDPVHRAAAVERGHVARGPQAVAGDEQHAVRIVRVDLDVGHPVRLGLRGPGRRGVVEPRTLEHRLPAPSAIGAAVDVVARGPAVERGRHDHVRVAPGHRHRTPSETVALQVARLRRRGDLGPGPAGRRPAPDRAIVHAVGPGVVAVAEQEVAAPVGHHVVGPQAGRLARHGLPGAARVGGAEQAALAAGNAGIDDRRRRTGLAAGRVESDEYDADVLLAPADGGGRFAGRQRGERLDPRPARAVVVAAPQPVCARTQEQHAPVVRVHGQAFAVAASQFIATQLERQVAALERSAAVARTQDRAVARAFVGVGAGGQVEAPRIGRIDRDALDAGEVGIVMAEPVGQRDPAPRRGIPAVRTAHVGTRIGQAALGGMELDAGDEAAAADGHVAPGVGLGRRACRGFAARPCQHGQQDRDGTHAPFPPRTDFVWIGARGKVPRAHGDRHIARDGVRTEDRRDIHAGPMTY